MSSSSRNSIQSGHCKRETLVNICVPGLTVIITSGASSPDRLSTDMAIRILTEKLTSLSYFSAINLYNIEY